MAENNAQTNPSHKEDSDPQTIDAQTNPLDKALDFQNFLSIVDDHFRAAFSTSDRESMIDYRFFPDRVANNLRVSKLANSTYTQEHVKSVVEACWGRNAHWLAEQINAGGLTLDALAAIHSYLSFINNDDANQLGLHSQDVVNKIKESIAKQHQEIISKVLEQQSYPEGCSDSVKQIYKLSITAVFSLWLDELLGFGLAPLAMDDLRSTDFFAGDHGGEVENVPLAKLFGTDRDATVARNQFFSINTPPTPDSLMELIANRENNFFLPPNPIALLVAATDAANTQEILTAASVGTESGQAEHPAVKEFRASILVLMQSLSQLTLPDFENAAITNAASSWQTELTQSFGLTEQRLNQASQLKRNSYDQKTIPAIAQELVAKMRLPAEVDNN